MSDKEATSSGQAPQARADTISDIQELMRRKEELEAQIKAYYDVLEGVSAGSGRPGGRGAPPGPLPGPAPPARGRLWAREASVGGQSGVNEDAGASPCADGRCRVSPASSTGASGGVLRLNKTRRCLDPDARLPAVFLTAWRGRFGTLGVLASPLRGCGGSRRQTPLFQQTLK